MAAVAGLYGLGDDPRHKRRLHKGTGGGGGGDDKTPDGFSEP